MVNSVFLKHSFKENLFQLYILFYCELFVKSIEMLFTVDTVVILLPFRYHFESKMFASSILTLFLLFSQFLDLMYLKKQPFFS